MLNAHLLRTNLHGRLQAPFTGNFRHLPPLRSSWPEQPQECGEWRECLAVRKVQPNPLQRLLAFCVAGCG
jgi:hypothetical protein